MRLLAEHVHEAGEVVVLGDPGYRGDAQQPVKGRVAVEFGDTGGEGGVTQGYGEDHDAPKDADGEVVAAFAAGLLQAREQVLVGQDF